jgi:hypothetical protein
MQIAQMFTDDGAVFGFDQRIVAVFGLDQRIPSARRTNRLKWIASNNCSSLQLKPSLRINIATNTRIGAFGRPFSSSNSRLKRSSGMRLVT